MKKCIFIGTKEGCGVNVCRESVHLTCRRRKRGRSFVNWNLFLLRRREDDSAPQRFNDQVGCFGLGEVLLSRNEVAIANGKAAPQASLHVVRADVFHFVFDPPRHQVFVFGQILHAPNCIVCKIFFDVRKSGDGISFGQVFAIREFRITQNGHTMTQGAGNLARFIKRNEFLCKLVQTIIERKERARNTSEVDSMLHRVQLKLRIS